MSNRIAPKLLVEFIGTFSLIFIGAGAAAVIGDGIGLPGVTAIALAHGLTVTSWAGFVIEAVLAFFLCTVVISTAVAGRARNLAPLAIGTTLILNIIMGGPLTGAAFNPARALGPMVATGNFNDAWLYLVAP